MKRLIFALSVALFFAVASTDAIAACYVSDPDNYACIDMRNDSSQYVTAYWDGNYGCNTAPGTTCTFIVPVGTHHFTAVGNNGASADFGDAYVTPGCCDEDHTMKVWDVEQ